MPQSELKTWAVARLDDIPDDHPEGWWDHEAATPGFGRRWHSVRRFFGVEGFGIAASGADAGEELIVPHTELGNDPDAEYVTGQEEVYFLVRGRARFELDGEGLDMAAGDILFVPPHVHRGATATEDDTLVLGVGGAPGKPYRGLDPKTYTPPANPGSVADRRAAGETTDGRS
jgi:mannose-6-phosphate isomerase-like protein (cupin superfamily)